jgi:hypothetical protein
MTLSFAPKSQFMNRARRRKGSFQKARDKVEKQEEVLHQGMAIRGINNRGKKAQGRGQKHGF